MGRKGAVGKLRGECGAASMLLFRRQESYAANNVSSIFKLINQRKVSVPYRMNVLTNILMRRT